MSELTDSFGKVDPAVYEFVDQMLPRIQNKLWNGRVYDANGGRLKDVGQLAAAIEAGTWPVAEAEALPRPAEIRIVEGPPWRETVMLAGEEARRQGAAWQALLERRRVEAAEVVVDGGGA